MGTCAKAVVACGLAVVLGPSGHAGMVSLTPSSGGNLTLNNPGTPIASSVFTPSPGNVFNDQGGTQYDSPIVRSGALFDLSGLPKGDVITAATLSLTVTNYSAVSISSAGFGLAGFASTDPTFTLADFSSASASLGFISLPGLQGHTPTTYTFDATQAVQGVQDFGFVLNPSGVVDGNNPVLTISYTGAPYMIPEPPSVALCGVAALVLAGGSAGRRRARSGP